VSQILEPASLSGFYEATSLRNAPADYPDKAVLREQEASRIEVNDPEQVEQLTNLELGVCSRVLGEVRQPSDGESGL
jgi:hypothetical protein